mmetsp:Transcript_9148/g.26358  ORF Transcript_9148/g.26358 Transcript_9148/m.26358 type:complete len:758 (+) Transcript_9148:80-2353(+)
MRRSVVEMLVTSLALPLAVTMVLSVAALALPSSAFIFPAPLLPTKPRVAALPRRSRLKAKARLGDLLKKELAREKKQQGDGDGDEEPLPEFLATVRRMRDVEPTEDRQQDEGEGDGEMADEEGDVESEAIGDEELELEDLADEQMKRTRVPFFWGEGDDFTALAAGLPDTDSQEALSEILRTELGLNLTSVTPLSPSTALLHFPTMLERERALLFDNQIVLPHATEPVRLDAYHDEDAAVTVVGLPFKALMDDVRGWLALVKVRGVREIRLPRTCSTRHIGRGYLRFDDHESAKQAREILSGQMMVEQDDRRLRTAPYRHRWNLVAEMDPFSSHPDTASPLPSLPAAPSRIYMGKLPSWVTEMDLRDFCESKGVDPARITSIELQRTEGANKRRSDGAPIDRYGTFTQLTLTDGQAASALLNCHGEFFTEKDTGEAMLVGVPPGAQSYDTAAMLHSSRGNGDEGDKWTGEGMPPFVPLKRMRSPSSVNPDSLRLLVDADAAKEELGKWLRAAGYDVIEATNRLDDPYRSPRRMLDAATKKGSRRVVLSKPPLAYRLRSEMARRIAAALDPATPLRALRYKQVFVDGWADRTVQSLRFNTLEGDVNEINQHLRLNWTHRPLSRCLRCNNPELVELTEDNAEWYEDVIDQLQIDMGDDAVVQDHLDGVLVCPSCRAHLTREERDAILAQLQVFQQLGRRPERPDRRYLVANGDPSGADAALDLRQQDVAKDVSARVLDLRQRQGHERGRVFDLRAAVGG